MNKPVIIFGANGIGKVVAEIFNSQNIIIYGFLDDKKELVNKEFMDVTVLGNTSDDGFLKFIGNKCEAFIATDNIKERKSLVDMLINRRKSMPMNAIHGNATIPKSASFSYGNLINDRVSVGANVVIGSHNLIHSAVVIDFNTIIGDFVQIGTGCVIGPDVKIEDEVFIGTGAVVVGGITIGKGARIGAGSVVVSEIKKGETVFGNPAKSVKV